MEVKELNTVAVISISINGEIESPSTGKEPSKMKSGLAGLKAAKAMMKGGSVKDVLEASVHTMENVVAAAPPTILDNINTSATVNLMPLDQILSNDAYKMVEPPKGFLGMQSRFSAENWKTIATTDADKIKSVAKELGVDGIMVVDLKSRW